MSDVISPLLVFTAWSEVDIPRWCLIILFDKRVNPAIVPITLNCQSTNKLANSKNLTRFFDSILRSACLFCIKTFLSLPRLRTQNRNPFLGGINNWWWGWIQKPYDVAKFVRSPFSNGKWTEFLASFFIPQISNSNRESLPCKERIASVVRLRLHNEFRWSFEGTLFHLNRKTIWLSLL